MLLKQMRPSISRMPPEDVLELVFAIRREREQYRLEKSKTVRSKSKEKAIRKNTAQHVGFKQVVANTSAEELLAEVEKLRKEKKGE